MPVEQLHQLGKIGERAGEAVDLVDHDDVEAAGLYVSKQLLQPGSVGRATRIAAIIIMAAHQRPAGMRLTADIGLGGITLGVERVEILVEPVIGGHPGINRTADPRALCRGHARASGSITFGLSRRPKKRGPFQRVPVMAKAVSERLA